MQKQFYVSLTRSIHVLICWFLCRSASQSQSMGSLLMRVHRRTGSALLRSKGRRCWRRWWWTDRWSFTCSCRRRVWTADTTEPAASSPSSVVTHSTAGNSPHISGVCECEKCGFVWVDNDNNNYTTVSFSSAFFSLQPYKYLWLCAFSPSCGLINTFIHHLFPGMSTVTSRRVWVVGSSRDAHYRIWDAPTVRGGFSPPHIKPLSPTSEQHSVISPDLSLHLSLSIFTILHLQYL